jgi:hypothetical protein
MIKVGYKYKVKYVNHKEISGGQITSLSIGEKIKGSNPAQFQNYSLTIWDNIDLMDGDDVKILTIESVESRVKGTKTYINLAGTVEVIPSENAKYAEEAPPEFTSEPETKDHIGDIDSEFALPFDI